MLNVNDFFPNCNFVSSVLYIYDYEAICMKFTPFQILKIALLKRIPALLNTALINHRYRVDITFLLNSQWAGKLALPAITILISLVNVFICKVPLPYLEPFILFLLTKERAYLWELVINHIPSTMRPHRQATASSQWSFFDHKYPSVPFIIWGSLSFLFGVTTQAAGSALAALKFANHCLKLGEALGLS